MSIVDKQYKELQNRVEHLQEAQSALEDFRGLVERIEATYPDSSYISHWYGTTFSITVGLTVKDIAVEMSEHLSVMGDFGIPLEDWRTTDDLENRKRLYTAQHTAENGAELNITLAACLANDATCRIEVIGYEEKEEMQYVGIKKTVPITQLVCAE